MSKLTNFVAGAAMMIAGFGISNKLQAQQTDSTEDDIKALKNDAVAPVFSKSMQDFLNEGKFVFQGSRMGVVAEYKNKKGIKLDITTIDFDKSGDINDDNEIAGGTLNNEKGGRMFFGSHGTWCAQLDDNNVSKPGENNFTKFENTTPAATLKKLLKKM